MSITYATWPVAETSNEMLKESMCNALMVPTSRVTKMTITQVTSRERRSMTLSGTATVTFTLGNPAKSGKYLEEWHKALIIITVV
eukprot:gene25239-27621_t